GSPSASRRPPHRNRPFTMRPRQRPACSSYSREQLREQSSCFASSPICVFTPTPSKDGQARGTTASTLGEYGVASCNRTPQRKVGGECDERRRPFIAGR